MAQDARNIEAILAKVVGDVQRELQISLPRKVGIIAKNHFTDNFRQGGFVNGGLQKWQVTKRQQSGGKGADSKYTPLTSRRDHLMRSITVHPSPGQVEVRNDVEYALIHNEGGTTHPTITKKMRKYAWARMYALAGLKKKGAKLPKDLPREAQMWKALALTKKTKLNIRIPKRQFIGDSKELCEKIDKVILATLNKITNGISAL